MIHKISLTVLGLAVTISCLWAQPEQELVKKCVAAMSGEQSLKRYMHYEGTGLVKVQFFNQNFSGTFNLVKAGEKSRLVIELDFSGEKFRWIKAYNGVAAFSDMEGDVSDLPDLNFKSDLSHSVMILVDPLTRYTLGKETEVMSRPAIAVEAELAGKKTTFYIDRQDYTVLEIAWSDMYVNENFVNELLEKRLQYENYQKIDGVFFPMKMTEYAKGQKTLELEFQTVKFAVSENPVLFERPTQKADYSYWEEKMN